MGAVPQDNACINVLDYSVSDGKIEVGESGLREHLLVFRRLSWESARRNRKRALLPTLAVAGGRHQPLSRRGGERRAELSADSHFGRCGCAFCHYAFDISRVSSFTRGGPLRGVAVLIVRLGTRMCDVPTDALVEACVIAGTSPGDVNVHKVTGGITNKLFRLEKKDGSGSVLLRLYGGEGLIDRVVETATFKALSTHLGRPACLGELKDGGGRVEEFLADHRTLTIDDVARPDTSLLIAAALARLHEFVPPPPLDEVHRGITLWATLRDWLAKAADPEMGAALAAASADDGALYEAEAAGVFDVKLIGRAVDALEAKAPQDTPVFAHNDLLPTNLMMDLQSGELRIIDLEYGGMSEPSPCHPAAFSYRAPPLAAGYNKHGL